MEQLDSKRQAFTAEETNGEFDAKRFDERGGELEKMNAIYSVAPMEPEKVAQGVATLYALMGSQDQGELTEAVANEYFRATQDIPQWAIEEAIERFRSGKEGDGRFVPKPPQLAAVARKVAESKAEYLRDKAKRDRNAREIAEQIERNERFKNRHAGKTDESRARVAAMHQRAKQTIAEATLANEERMQSDPGNKLPGMKEAQERFADQARQELVKSMENENG